MYTDLNLDPVSRYSEETGKCTIGLTMITLVALLGYDLFINTILTVLFVNFLLTPLRFRYQNSASAQSPSIAQRISALGQSKEQSTSADAVRETAQPRGVINANSTDAIENLLRKSLTGLILVMFPTIVNLAVLLRFQGHEPGWLCFIMCQADGMLVILSWSFRRHKRLTQPQSLFRSSSSIG